MSALKEFENSETWREDLKKFLLMERKPTPVISGPVKYLNRHSLDVDDDLIPEKFKNPTKQNVKNDKKLIQNVGKELSNVGVAGADDGAVGGCAAAENFYVSDDSFRTMEHICEKSASDPNSTLFNYLHSDVKEKVLAEAKKRYSDEHPPDTLHLNHDSTLKDFDETQLDDIEPPSKLWEESTINEVTLQTSPVKMVGLLRPSTIMEEDSMSESVSQLSFKTCSKDAPYESISTVASYKTATDSTFSSSCAPTESDVKQNISATNTDDDEKCFKNFQQMPDDDDCENGSDDARSDLDKNLIVISDDETSDEEKQSYEDKENQDDSNNVREISTCPKFNDTLEEVDYLMKKQEEYLASASKPKIEKKSVASNFLTVNAVHTGLSSPRNNRQTGSNSSSRNASPIFKTTPKLKVTEHKDLETKNIAANKEMPKKYELEFKQPPKFDFFKKPILQKNIGSPNKFANIVSPIGTYIKKTGTVPLITSRNAKRQILTMQPSVAHKYHYEQLNNQGNSEIVHTDGKTKMSGLPSETQVWLPKKAFISSAVKQVTDERTPFTIPGGEKIQKYVSNAANPAVIRHEGKIKFPAGSRIPLPRTTKGFTAGSIGDSGVGNTDESLSNFSVLSGDISVYTIKDAQKF